MNKRMPLIVSILLVVSLLFSSCDISITINPTSAPAVPNTPRPANTPRPTATDRPALTDEPVHEMYAGFTDDSQIPFLILHPDGEKLGLTLNSNTSNVTGDIWVSPSGNSIVIYSGGNGLPEKAVIGDVIVLYSNYTNSTVDVTIIESNGERYVVRTDFDVDEFNRIKALTPSSYSLISFPSAPTPPSFDKLALDVAEEGLFMLGVGACITAASAAAAGLVTGPLDLPVLGLAGLACAGPLVTNALWERKATGVDIGNLENMSTGLDVLGCGKGALQKKLDKDCLSLILKGLRGEENNASNKAIPTQVIPTKKPKYP